MFHVMLERWKTWACSVSRRKDSKSDWLFAGRRTKVWSKETGCSVFL